MSFESDFAYTSFIGFLSIILCFSYGLQSNNTAKLDTQDAFPEIRLNFSSYHLLPNSNIANNEKIAIKPQKLEFKIKKLNEIYRNEFYIHNPTTNQSIKLLYIKSQNELFYSSYAQDKVILPSEALQINVFYNGKAFQNVSSSLLVVTSVGIFEYLVTASSETHSLSNSLLNQDGAIIPVLDEDFPFVKSLIPQTLRPYSVRVYLMSRDIYVELSRHICQHDVMSPASHQYQATGHHSLKFQRILRFRPFIITQGGNIQPAFMNLSTQVFFLSLPVDHNFDNKDLFNHILENFHFESDSATRTFLNKIKWRLINTYSKLTRSLNEANESQSILNVYKFEPEIISPHIRLITILSALYFNNLPIESGESLSGDIIVMNTHGNMEISLHFSLTTFKGALDFNSNGAIFSLDSSSNEKQDRRIIIENSFKSTVHIFDVKLNSDASPFTLIKTYKKKWIPPLASAHLFTLSFQSSKFERYIPSEVVYIYTNISIFTIPLFVNSNKLTIIASSRDNNLDLGTVGFKETRSALFCILNDNSIPISVEEIGMPSGDALLFELLSIHNQFDKSIFSSQPKKLSQEQKSLTIPPFCVANFRVKILSQTIQGNFSSYITMATKNQNLQLNVSWKIVDGSVQTEPSTVQVNECYPGKTCYSELVVRSTFSDFLELKNVRFQVNRRLNHANNCEEHVTFMFEPSPGRQLPMLLRPNESTVVGRIAVDLGQSFQFGLHSDNPHIGFSTDSNLGEKWLQTVSNLSDISIDVDQEIWHHLTSQWQYFVSLVTVSPHNLLHSLLMSKLMLDTNQFAGFQSNIQVELSWPKLSQEVVDETGYYSGQESGLSSSNLKFLQEDQFSKPKSNWRSKFVKNSMTQLQDKPAVSYVDFGLTQLGNTSIKKHVLSNAADVPILVHVVPFHLYPHNKDLLGSLGFSVTDRNTSKSLRKSESSTIYVSISEQSDDFVPHTAHTGTLLISLPPRSNLSINIHFRPLNSRPLDSYLILRNNLSGIEVVQLTARVAQGKLLFKNLPTKNSDPLLFELTEKHLKNCDKSTQMKGVAPNFTVRRPLVIQNAGLLPVYIHGFNFEPLDEEEDILENVLTRLKPWVQPLNAIIIKVNKFCESSIPESIIRRSPLSTWCRGYGFEVQDCHGFLLKPNASKKLQITFTPDFSLHKVLLYLRVHTSLNGPVHQYYLPVKATLPAHMLSRCSQALDRPEIEVFLWYGLLVSASILTLLIVALAYFNADSIFTRSVLQRRQVLMSSQCSNSRGSFTSANYAPGMTTSILPKFFSFNSSPQDAAKTNYYNIRESIATSYTAGEAEISSKSQRGPAKPILTSSTNSHETNVTRTTIMASKIETGSSSEFEVSRRSKKPANSKDSNDVECTPYSSSGKPIILPNGGTTLEQRTSNASSHDRRNKLSTALHWCKSVFNHFYYSQSSVMRSKLRPNSNLSSISSNLNTNFVTTGGKRLTNRSAVNNKNHNQKSSNSPLLRSGSSYQYSPSANHNRSNRAARSRCTNKNSVGNAPTNSGSNPASVQNSIESIPTQSLSTPDFAPIDIPVPDCRNSGSNNRKNYSKKVKKVIEECFAKQNISRYYNQNDDNTSVMTDSSVEEKVQADNNSARENSSTQSKKRKSQCTTQQQPNQLLDTTLIPSDLPDVLSDATAAIDSRLMNEFSRDSLLTMESDVDEDIVGFEEEGKFIGNNHQYSENRRNMFTVLLSNDEAFSQHRLGQEGQLMSQQYSSQPATTTISVNKVVPLAVARPAPRGPLTSVVKPVIQHSPVQSMNVSVNKPVFGHKTATLNDKNPSSLSKASVSISGNWSSIVSTSNANSSSTMVPLQQMHHHHHHHHHTHLELSMRTQSPAPGTRTSAGSVARKYVVQQQPQQSKVYSDSAVGPTTTFYNGASPMHWHGVIKNNSTKSSPIHLHHGATFPNIATAAYHPMRHRLIRSTGAPTLRPGQPLQPRHIAVFNCPNQPVTAPAAYHSIHSHQPIIASPFIPTHSINRVTTSLPVYAPGPYYTPYSTYIPVTSTLPNSTASPLHVQTNSLPRDSSRCSSSQSDSGGGSNSGLLKQSQVLPSCVLQELNSTQGSPEKKPESVGKKSSECEINASYAPETQPTSSASMNNKYELPRITKGRRQLMLEYERRYQLRKDGPGVTHNDSDLSNHFCESVDYFCDSGSSDLLAASSGGGGLSYDWEQNPVSWSHDQAVASNYWDDIEPGSIEDQMANNLLPPNLLGSDTNGVGLGAMPDDFDENNFEDMCYDPSLFIFPDCTDSSHMETDPDNLLSHKSSDYQFHPN